MVALYVSLNQKSQTVNHLMLIPLKLTLFFTAGTCNLKYATVIVNPTPRQINDSENTQVKVCFILARRMKSE